MNNKLQQVLVCALDQRKEHSYDPEIAKLFNPIIELICKLQDEK